MPGRCAAAAAPAADRTSLTEARWRCWTSKRISPASRRRCLAPPACGAAAADGNRGSPGADPGFPRSWTRGLLSAGGRVWFRPRAWPASILGPVEPGGEVGVRSMPIDSIVEPDLHRPALYPRHLAALLGLAVYLDERAVLPRLRDHRGPGGCRSYRHLRAAGVTGGRRGVPRQCLRS
jgi:hypothetical protein